MKKEKKWLFYESCNVLKNPNNHECYNKYRNIEDNNNESINDDMYSVNHKYKEYLEDVDILQHRLATKEDLEDGLKNGMNVEGYGFISNDNLYNISSLVKPEIIEQNINGKKKYELNLDYINKADIHKYNNKGLYCYGRKPDNSKLSKENDYNIFHFNQKKIKQNIQDIKKYENIEYFNVPNENYSYWN